MKAVKILAVLLGVYVLIVVAFESFIGYSQPTSDDTITIITTDAEGASNPRVLSRINIDDQLYVAANHWPRAWYEQALENPSVQVTIDGEMVAYTAVPVRGQEHDRIESARPLPFVVKFLTGFPPRYFIRLDRA